MSERPERGLVRLEDDRVSTRGIVAALLLTVMATVLSILLARALFDAHERALRTRPEASSLEPPGQVTHGLIAVERTGQRDAGRDEQTLESYGWIDRDRRLVRIPVTRAIELELAALTSGSTPQGRNR